MFYRRFSRLLTQKLLRSVRKSFFTSIVMSSCRDWRIRLAIIFSTTAHDPPSHDVTLNISYIHCTTALMCISLIKLIKVWSTFFLNNSLREQTKKYFSQIFCKWLCSLVCASLLAEICRELMANDDKERMANSKTVNIHWIMAGEWKYKQFFATYVDFPISHLSPSPDAVQSILYCQHVQSKSSQAQQTSTCIINTANLIASLPEATTFAWLQNAGVHSNFELQPHEALKLHTFCTLQHHNWINSTSTNLKDKNKATHLHQRHKCSGTSSRTLYVASVMPDEFNMRRSVINENRLCGIIASCLRL